MSKMEALERARQNWGPKAIIHFWPRSGTCLVGVVWFGFALMGYGSGKTWEMAFKKAEAVYPPRKRGVKKISISQKR